MKKFLIVLTLLTIICVGIIHIVIYVNPAPQKLDLNVWEDHNKLFTESLDLSQYNVKELETLNIDENRFSILKGNVEKIYLYTQTKIDHPEEYFQNYLVLQMGSQSEDISFELNNEKDPIIFVRDYINYEHSFIVSLGASGKEEATCLVKPIEAKNKIIFSDFSKGLSSIRFVTPGYFTLFGIEETRLNGIILQF